jgi:hypothetical protein
MSLVELAAKRKTGIATGLRIAAWVILSISILYFLVSMSSGASSSQAPFIVIGESIICWLLFYAIAAIIESLMVIRLYLQAMTEEGITMSTGQKQL